MSEEKQETPPVAAPPVAAPSKPKNVQIQDLEGENGKKVAYTKTFTVDYLNPDDGNRLVGTFTAKRPTLGDLSQFGALKARYNSGERVSRDIDWLNEMLAFCQITLTTSPDWWDPTNAYDEELLTLIYNHVRSFQDSFRRRVEG
jgi:hypothetical protein